MFRAFLGYSEKELKRMTIDEFINCSIMLDRVLKLWHAPYIEND